MKCDRCHANATFTVTAAYPACEELHPHWATYPALMHRVCSVHLAAVIADDASRPGATPGYLVRLR